MSTREDKRSAIRFKVYLFDEALDLQPISAAGVFKYALVKCR